MLHWIKRLLSRYFCRSQDNSSPRAPVDEHCREVNAAWDCSKALDRLSERRF